MITPGQLAEETDGAGTLLARYTYDSGGVPTSGQVGNDPATAPRDYYVYNGHGDVVALTDASGTSVAAYAYDAWGAVTVDTEHFPNGWRNPYLYDGRDGARYDAETGLYWLSVRAYDPTLGRFLSHDPLGRAPLFFADQPYVYAGNNPLLNVDPSGQRQVFEDPGTRESTAERKQSYGGQRMATIHYEACGTSCKRWRDIAALAAHFTHILLVYLAVFDGAAMVMNFALLALDIGNLIVNVGDIPGWVNAVLDFATFFASALTFYKDVRLLQGASSGEEATLASIAAFGNALAGIANFVRAAAGFMMLFSVGGALRTGFKKLVEFLAPRLTRVIVTLLQANANFVGMTTSSVEAILAGLNSMGLPELRKLCKRSGVQCA
jgi:RHS repeat-associated protein